MFSLWPCSVLSLSFQLYWNFSSTRVECDLLQGASPDHPTLHRCLPWLSHTSSFSSYTKHWHLMCVHPLECQLQEGRILVVSFILWLGTFVETFISIYICWINAWMNEWIHEWQHIVILVTFPRRFGTISLCPQCGSTLMLIVMWFFTTWEVVSRLSTYSLGSVYMSRVK